jgi:hypothetical protein
LLEAAVADDDDRAAFVTAADEREAAVGGLAFKREVADPVRRSVLKRMSARGPI